MNTQLYNQLIEARKFLITVKKNEEDLIHRKHLIKFPPFFGPKNLVYINIPSKKIDWLKFIYIYALTAGIGGIIYILYIFFYNRNLEKKKHIEYDEWKNSSEGKKAKKDAEEYRAEQEKELKIKQEIYKKYYMDNYWKYLGFLPDWARKFDTVDSVSHGIEYINGLISYVKNGATTLNEAIKYYAEELRERSAMEEARERAELLERRHKEELSMLNTIARNQEKTNDELERLYKDTYLKRH